MNEYLTTAGLKLCLALLTMNADAKFDPVEWLEDGTWRWVYE